MCEVRVPQAKYSLLIENHHFCKKYSVYKVILLFLVCCLFVFALLYGLYFYVGDSEDRVHFPTFPTQVPQHNYQRAFKYNNNNKQEINLNEVPKPQKNLQTNPTIPNDFKIICYYNFPSRNFHKQLSVEQIDSKLCTHINVAFASILNNSIHLDDYQLNISANLMELKKTNNKLKILLSVGGSGNDDGFAEMVLNHENRKTFIKSILYFVKEHKFDGVDLDWEFPNEESKNDSKQRMHFTQLLHEIRNEINRQQKHRFLLSVAVAAPQFLIDLCYDISYMNEYVDYVNLMSYDYHYFTNLTPFTGINAPLYSPPNDIGYFSTLNINFSANYWVANGLDKNKLIIGLPTYGHTFTLRNVNNNGIKAPAEGYGKLGGGGFTDFKSICWFLKKNQISPIFDEISKSPYASKSTEWISYDDVKSIEFKADFIKKNNFGGAMLYALNTDDYEGVCSESDKVKITFPLIRKVREVLDDEEL